MSVRIINGDCRDVLRTLPDASVQCCVTSPPYYGLRDYGVDGQIGLEPTPDAYVAELVAVFREVRRVLRDDATLWLNLGDSYFHTNQSGPQGKSGQRASRTFTAGGVGGQLAIPGIKPKDLLMIPARVALALQADGWWLRSHIIWHKPNPMPESVKDRPTNAHESVFLFAKQERYFYDADAVAEPATYAGQQLGICRGQKRRAEGMRRKPSGNEVPGADVDIGQTRNLRNVWSIISEPYRGAHFATMPATLAERCIMAGSRRGDTVLDPFGGVGTTGLAADRIGRDGLLIELNGDHRASSASRIVKDAGLFAEVA